MSTVLSSEVRDLVARYHRVTNDLRSGLFRATHLAKAALSTNPTMTHEVQDSMQRGSTLAGDENSGPTTSSGHTRTDPFTQGAWRLAECEGISSALRNVSENFLEDVSRQLQAEREAELAALTAEYESELGRLAATDKSIQIPSETTDTSSKSSALVAFPCGTSAASLKMALLPRKTKRGLSSVAATTSAAVAAATTGQTVTRSNHSKPVCKESRAALEHASRLVAVGDFATAGEIVRKANITQHDYTLRESIPCHSRFVYKRPGSATSVPLDRRQQLASHTRSTQAFAMAEIKKGEKLNQLHQWFENQVSKLRHRQNVEQQAAKSLLALAMSAPAEERHVSQMQLKIQRQNAAEHQAALAALAAIPIHPREDPSCEPMSGATTSRWGSPLLKKSSTLTRYPSSLLGVGTSTHFQTPRSVRTSALASPHQSHLNLKNVRPSSPVASEEYGGRVGAATSALSGRKSSSHLHAPTASPDAQHSVARLTSGSVLDGVAAPGPFGTRPPSSKVASGNGRPQTAQARLGIPRPKTAGTPQYVALCDAYGDSVFDVEFDETESETVHRSHGPSRRQSLQSSSPTPRSLTSQSHNPRVNVTGTRYLRAVAAQRQRSGVDEMVMDGF